MNSGVARSSRIQMATDPSKRQLSSVFIIVFASCCLQVASRAVGSKPGTSRDEGKHEITILEGASVDHHEFEGVGALSAGASSRLLRDYPPEQRNEVLNLLFMPSYGASVQVLKIEIGGDMQSTDGSEPSHMHARGEEPDCTRGYETWLVKEAMARNPKIRTYGLAWGVPGWIGNGSFFSDDNIRYHVSWLECMKSQTDFEIDYIGIWNEMPWGNTWYVEALVQRIAEVGLSTRLVLLDAIHGVDQGFIDLFSRNASFRQMVDVVGLHYPCENYKPLSNALALDRSTRFWSSEELSTVADWDGAGCWGRMINQNFVRMNATASIAWSLVWSTYPNLECFGNGLLYAFEPWSGHYEVTPPVWTMAHTTQFADLGWKYLPSGVGADVLPEGGTFVTLVSPDFDHFSIVLETLSGQCMYHAGCHHTQEASAPQRLRLRLGDPDLPHGLRSSLLKHGHLEHWTTNRTGWFDRLPDLYPDDHGIVEFIIYPDSIITLTTLRRASRRGDLRETNLNLIEGGLIQKNQSIPASAPFPLPYAEDFEGTDVGREARFFADQGGAFEVVTSEDGEPKNFVDTWMPVEDAKKRIKSWHANKVLEQRVLVHPIAWNGRSPDPFTTLGGVNWTDVEVQVLGRVGANASRSENKTVYMGVCLRMARYHFFASMEATPEGYCLKISTGRLSASWSLTASGQSIAEGALETPMSHHIARNGWIQLRLEARRARIRGWIEDFKVVDLIDTSLPFGQVGLQCGYHYCQFDELHVSKVAPRLAFFGENRRYLFHGVHTASFNYDARSCDPPPSFPRRRFDFSGFVGLAFETRTSLSLTALGRLVVSGGQPWARVHNVSVFEVSNATLRNVSLEEMQLVVSVALPTAAVNQMGVEETDDGWTFVGLQNLVVLNPGNLYILASSELTSGDAFYDRGVHVDPDADVIAHGPAYKDQGGWHLDRTVDVSRIVYGPLNAVVESAPSSASSSVAKSYRHRRFRGIQKIF